ncbi:MAG: hypothetical protein ACRDTT_16965 [Pseudonocardiaceae bacterium]
MQMWTGKRATVIPDWLYISIVASLGIYFVIGIIVWSIMILNGRSVPDSFATILATIAGGLVGKLAPAGFARRSDIEKELSQ